MSEQTSDNFFVLTFAEAKQPEYKEKKGAGNGYIEFGENNDYPNYLLDLYDRSPKHGAIVQGKVIYITGSGWAVEGTDKNPIAEDFINKVNRQGETLYTLTEKICTDIEIFGGAYVQVIWGKFGGSLSELYHIDYLKIRTNEDNTQFWFKKDWQETNRCKAVPMKAFNPNERSGKQILYLKEYRPGLKAYALPGYMQALNNIEADIEVSRHTLGNAKTGFTPSKYITLFEGTDDETKKKTIERKIKDKFTGSKGQKIIISFAKNKENIPEITDLGSSDLTKEDFTPVNNMIGQEIFTAHKITSPMLFGIKTEGQLGGSTELIEAYEIFKATYVNKKQTYLEQAINELAKYRGITTPLHIIPVDPLSMQLSETTISSAMTKDEIRERAGLEPLPQPQKSQAQIITEALNSMSPLVANKVLESLTEDEIRSLANLQPKAQAPANPQQQFSDQDLNIFEEFGDTKDNYTIVHSRKVKFESNEDLVWDEENSAPVAIKFAEQNLTTLESNILDLISKDKRITPEIIRDTLQVDFSIIKRVLQGLVDKGLLNQKTDKMGNISRELTRPLPEVKSTTPSTTTDLLIRYSYEGPKDEKNRPFCAYLLNLDRLYSRSDIEQMSTRLGYSVFDRRGGWYTVPGTDEHRPFCRHSWTSQVVIKNNNG